MLYPHWNAQELPEASPPGPPPGALPLDPNGALKRVPGPHAARLARVAPFDFLHFVQALLNQWGTLEQSYATAWLEKDLVVWLVELLSLC